MLERLKAVVIGHAVGDALGVPVEFCDREELKDKPITEMVGYGSYPVPPGAWSDDTSMSLAALDSLANGSVDFEVIMDNFVKWCSCDGSLRCQYDCLQAEKQRFAGAEFLPFGKLS